MDWDNRYIRQYPHLSNIYEGGNGTIWFNGSGSSSGRTGILSFRDGIVRIHRLDISNHPNGDWTYQIIETKQGHILAVGAPDSPYIYDGNDADEWKNIPGYGRGNPTNSFWLGWPDNRILAAFQDKDGSIWVNGNQGIWRLYNQEWSEYRDVESKPVPWGQDFIRGPNGVLWAATIEGIYRLNSDEKWVIEW